MKRYTYLLAILGIGMVACSKEGEYVSPTEKKTPQSLFMLNGHIKDFELDQDASRSLHWDVENGSGATEADLVPRVAYTQEEFSGRYSPGEITDPTVISKFGTTPQYWMGDPGVDGQPILDRTRTEVSIKLYKRDDTNPKALRFTVWNGRDFNSRVQGGKGIVKVSDDGRKISIFLPMDEIPAAFTTFNGEWYMGVTLGGRSGGYNHNEGVFQYYSPYANGTISKNPDDPNYLNLYRQNGTLAGGSGGYHPSLTEPNRYQSLSDAKSQYNLAAGRNLTLDQVKAGLGLQEIVGKQRFRRNFPMMTRIVKLKQERRSPDAATSLSTTYPNYVYPGAELVFEPRGSIAIFRFENKTGKKIRLDALEGSHGKLKITTQDDALQYDRTALIDGAYTKFPARHQNYKAIDYTGAYMFGPASLSETAVKKAFNQWLVANVGAAGTGEGPKAPFIGTTATPEKFYLYDKNGNKGVELEPDALTQGRFYLWFSAQEGAEFSVRLHYTEINADGTESAMKTSIAQRVNLATRPNFKFEDGKAYGATVKVKAL